jgi:YjbR
VRWHNIVSWPHVLGSESRQNTPFLRRLALAFPGAREEARRCGPWFNIGKKPFALFWGKEGKWTLRLPEQQVMMLIEVDPAIFSPMKSGSMLWIYIDVEKMNAKMLKAYFTAAWRHTATK